MFYFHEAWDSRETLILVRLFSYSFFFIICYENVDWDSDVGNIASGACID